MWYANDTLILGVTRIDNFQNIKAILWGFELASGLMVNLAKCSLIGVNFNPIFLDLVTDFLNCYHQSYPLKYLIFPVEGISILKKLGSL